MFLPACITALLLMFSVHGVEVVARLHFSQSSYVVKEGPEICVDVINETPTTTAFRVNYKFSTALNGMSDIVEDTRQDAFTFPANSSEEQLCIMHENDESICEGDISGTIELSSNSAVLVSMPRIATVTVQDDDIVNASFKQQNYELNEGSSIADAPVVNATISSDVVLEVIKVPISTGVLAIVPSLSSTPITLTLDSKTKHVPLQLNDDNIALEDPEAVNLSLRVSPGSPCSNVNLIPLISTTLLIHDNDIVIAELTRSTGTVREGESHQVCINLSKPIARKLNFTLQIKSETAQLDDLDGSTMEMSAIVFQPLSELRKCITITVAEDNVVEGKETFKIKLNFLTILPASLRDNVHLGTTTSTITIDDASSCTNYSLDRTTTPSVIYVHKKRTLCFFCSTCISQMAWNLTSHRGNSWIGVSGQLLQSENRIPDNGNVLENGTLVVANSSKVFSEVIPGTLRFRELQTHEAMSSEYEVYIGERAEVTDLQYTTMDSIDRLTCHFTGIPKPQVDWLSDSQPIVNEELIIEQIDTEGESVLLIDSKVARDLNMMTYMCRVSNTFGFDSSMRTITPRVKPAPINRGYSLHYPIYSLLLFSLLLSQL